MQKTHKSLIVVAAFGVLSSLHSSPIQAADFGAVKVGGVSIKGLNQTEATLRLKRELSPKLRKRVKLVARNKAIYRRRSDLGFSLNISRMLAQANSGKKSVPVLFAVNQKQIGRAMNRLNKTVTTRARNARPIYFKGRVRIRPEVNGMRLVPSTSAARIKALAEKDPTTRVFKLETKSWTPTLPASRLKGINSVLKSFTTEFNLARKTRTHNVKLAVKAIDATLLGRGEVFSLNDTVGARTPQRGYKKAIIFKERRKQQDYGGGVSQVTGTLFNAALLAGLPIVTYRVHTQPVTYLPIARDATVSWGSFDMKFKNDTGAPIFISYKVRGSRLTATLFGKRTGRQVTLRVSKKQNKPRDITAKLFRVIRQNGKVVKKEQVGGTSHYNWKEDPND